MENHTRFNTALVEVASEIDRILSEVILLQRDYVLKVCPACERPCCERVGHLFDERDVIFLKVFFNRTAPRKRSRTVGGCAFLSPDGCLLEPESRPFICHRYLCVRLKNEMTRKEPGMAQLLHNKFRALEELRGRLWREYLETSH